MSANKQEIKKELDNKLLDALAEDKPPVVFSRYRRINSFNNTGNLDTLQKFQLSLDSIKEPGPKKPEAIVKDEDINLEVLNVASKK